VRGQTIEVTDLDVAPAGEKIPARDELLEGDLPSAVAKLEAAMIRAALAACGGNRTEAARRLNIHRQLLYTKMQRYGLAGPESSANQTPPVGKADV
jgi:DNA-binding NtrC family response regulator